MNRTASSPPLREAVRFATSSGFVWAAAAAFVVGSTGCSEADRALSEKRPEDLELAERVRDELDEQAAARGVRVRVEGGRVTLYGQVPSVDDRERVERLVTQIAGVDEIDNDLSASGAVARGATRPSVATQPSSP